MDTLKDKIRLISIFAPTIGLAISIVAFIFVFVNQFYNKGEIDKNEILIIGKIYNINNGKPLNQVKIIFGESKKQVMTNHMGEFEVKIPSRFREDNNGIIIPSRFREYNNRIILIKEGYSGVEYEIKPFSDSIYLNLAMRPIHYEDGVKNEIIQEDSVKNEIIQKE